MYKESELDRQLTKRFTNDGSNNFLRSVELKEGKLRALNHFKISFQYPISLIAGANGSGKSTLLAIVACGFHNNIKQPIQVNKKKVKESYYTFKDFLVQSKQESAPSGIKISYETAQIEQSTKKLILKAHELKKVVEGKWSNYQKRIIKNVEYFGLERVVPHYEKSVSKSYRKSFIPSERTDVEERTEASVSKVLGKTYSNFALQKHGEHTLPSVNRETYSYSGFNMGAGENALFNIFFVLHSCPKASLIVIDEIELGLHAQAQVNFINELKVLCNDKNLQIIATTHSSSALTAVPPYARFFIQSSGNQTEIEEYITAEYATGKLIGKNSEELKIFVEDEVAEQILISALPLQLRERVIVKHVGSDNLVAKNLAAAYAANENAAVIAYIDGDGISKISNYVSAIKTIFERKNDEEIKAFCDSKIYFLGKDMPPEKWLISEVKATALNEFMEEMDISNKDKADELLASALIQNTHYELTFLASALHLDVNDLTKRLARVLFRVNSELKQQIIENISKALNGETV